MCKAPMGAVQRWGEALRRGAAVDGPYRAAGHGARALGEEPRRERLSRGCLNMHATATHSAVDGEKHCVNARA